MIATVVIVAVAFCAGWLTWQRARGVARKRARERAQRVDAFLDEWDDAIRDECKRNRP